MFTIEDVRKTHTEDYRFRQEIVDKWLKTVVAPNIVGKGAGFGVPKNYIGSLKDLKDDLEIRGFSVETASSYQGSFVYFNDEF